MIPAETRAVVESLKRDLNAIVLAHNYQSPEIHAVADVIGDSLELALAARDTAADLLFVCGVMFMAETAKILNPGRRVFIPVPDAGCPLAGYLTPDLIRESREKYPDAAVVIYINSTAACKAEADIVCTSGNAVRVVRSLPHKRILFGPDRNLASFVSEQVRDKEIIFMPGEGHCYVHQSFTAGDIRKARETGGVIIAHPECPEEVRKGADIVASTGRMISIIREGDSRIWHIFTEEGMVIRLQNLFPDRIFYHPGAVCKDMRITKIEDLISSMKNLHGEIRIPDEIRDAARRSLDRMLEVQ
jgi:quinolinate synthase